MSYDPERVTELCRRLTAGNVNLLVPWYLIASYAYYHLDESLLTDECYDEVCFLLGEGLDTVSIVHDHMHLCDPAALQAGTAYQMKKKDYPTIVKRVAEKFTKGEMPL